MSFSLFTRVTAVTWPQLQPHARQGDLFWGRVDGIPTTMRALTFPNYAGLVDRLARDKTDYAAYSFDGEDKDANLVYEDAKQVRQLIAASGKRIKFVAFFHLNTLKARPDIVKLPQVVIFGKTNWDAEDMRVESAPYVAMVQEANRTPAILLGNLKADEGVKVDNSPEEVVANFEAVLALGITTISYFYALDKAGMLINALTTLRS